MEVVFSINYQDYKDAVLAINDKFPQYNKSKLRLCLFVTFFFFWIVPYSYVVKLASSVLLCMLLYYFLIDPLIRFALKVNLSLKNKDAYPKEISLVLSEKNFRYKSNVKDYTVPWDTITIATETTDFHIVYTASINTLFIFKKKISKSEADPLKYQKELNRILHTYSKTTVK